MMNSQGGWMSVLELVVAVTVVGAAGCVSDVEGGVKDGSGVV
jgi:hypothetical protein